MLQLLSRHHRNVSKSKRWRLVLSSLLILSSGYSQAESLLFTTEDWRPFVFAGETNVQAQMPGFSVEIVNAAFRNMGYSIEYEPKPFKRQIKETQSGKYAGIVGLLASDAPNLIYPKEGVGEIRNCFYVGKHSRWHYEQPESLRQVVLGVIGGYTYGVIDSHIWQYRDSQIYVYSGDNDKALSRLIELVQAQRVDVVVEDEAVMEFYLVQSGLKGNVKQVGCLDAEPAMVGFTPKDSRAQEWADEFDKQVDSMRKSGELRRILGKYGVSDWSPIHSK
ncbi:putative ABC transporter, periplasmic domain [Vibrio tapetis subsp. tapetis]|uniref:Putative ABC transporter, periplasmic domain n=1 Tax=Vibrio tapetis subsp. tapetis TaxID=1671868 RepID=A0A2N8ZKM5_9VIBR|nr:putative ABC transporter, periplasmic domain [Vibrio tapetis subsp. tapetis]